MFDIICNIFLIIFVIFSIIKVFCIFAAKYNTMVRERIEEIMKEKGIPKAEFARRMNIKPQNVNVVLDTDNLKKLMKIAEVIGCDVSDFLGKKNQEPQHVINGFIEYDGVLYAIKSMSDLINLQGIINQSQQ